ncbi:hypothetical protein DI383_02215 [Flavobacteriaceae bacterium LYZ1037]|nr:hypothetical protein DI383_02215 [Flavobacteriaceae bacterium LYZ1037]
MISIIVSSYQPTYYKALVDNISLTIGNVVYEVIRIDNPGLMGISEAYNKGAIKAQYPYLCFVHEDVLFHTNNWGINLINHLKGLEIGAIGVAGSAYKSFVPSTWSLFKPYIASNLIQHVKNQDKTSYLNKIQGKEDENMYEVVTLDGVFIATHKTIWEKGPFDEKLLKGFHGYDMDFSLQVAQDHKLYVVFDILLEHFSEGNPNNDWMQAAMTVSDKWKKYLPTHCIPNLLETDRLNLETKAKTGFKKRLKRFGYKKLNRILLYLKYL